MDGREHEQSRRESRGDRIHRVVEDCLNKRLHGEIVADETIIQTHPELMPELGEELAKLRLIEAARNEAIKSRSSEPSLGFSVGQHTGKHIRCPHCLNAIEVIQEHRPEEIVCPSCGSSFSLEPGPTIAWTPKEGDRHLGKFELVDQLGVGAFGTVYLARDPELDRLAAIKVPRAGNLAGDESLDRFLREARSVAQLRHPNIVPVYEVGQTHGVPFLVSEYVRGATLADQLTTSRFTFRRSAELVAEVAGALQYAHDQGVIHRDLKPSNILLDMKDRPHVMDFGLAKREAGEITMTMDGQLLGTPAYMSPEQAAGEAHKVDGRSDVYSLGVILYELLTGALPFRGNARMLVVQVLREEPRAPRQLNDRIPRDLETICLKCLEKDPQRRFGSAQDLAEELRRFLDGKPIRSRPIGAVERTMRWARRRPAVAALLCVTTVALMGVVGVIVGGMYHLQLSRAFRATDLQRARAETALVETESARRAEEHARKAEQQQGAKAESYLYFSRIILAEREWSNGNVARTLQLLESCPAQLRGWEWNYLRRVCNTELTTLRGHAGAVDAVAFSREGRWLATCSEDKTVKLWDVASGRELRTLTGHQLPVNAVAFSPTDARVVSAASHGNATGRFEVKLWDGETGEELLSLDEAEGSCDSLVFSPDGAWIAASSALHYHPGRVAIYQATTGEEIARLTGHTGPVVCTAFSPDGSLIATSSGPLLAYRWFKDPGEVKLWDSKTFKELRSLTGHVGAVHALAFDHAGRRLASAGVDGVRVWELPSGRRLHTFLGFTTDVAFSPDGQLLATSSENSVKLRDLTTGHETAAIRGHTDQVRSVAFEPMGHVLASASADHTVRLWDTRFDQASFALEGHTDRINDMAISRDGKLIVSGSADRSARIWDSVTGQELMAIDNGMFVFGVAISSDNQRLATVEPVTSTLKIWDLTTGKLVATAQVAAGSVVFSPDDQRLACAGGSLQANKPGHAAVYDAATGKQLLELQGHADAVQSIRFSPNGEHLVTASVDKTVRIWSGSDGRQVLSIDLSSEAWDVAFDPSGNLIAIASDETILWNQTENSEVLTIPSRSSCLAFSPDGRRIATAEAGGTLRLWNVESGQEVFTLRGGADYVSSIAFRPDGQGLVSVGTNELVTLWEAEPVTRERINERLAAKVVNRLGRELVFKDEMIAAIRRDDQLSEPVQQQALLMVERHHEDVYRLRTASMNLVSEPDRDPAMYRLGRRQAETGARLQPDNHYWQYLKGIALYRLGEYRAALQSFTEYQSLSSRPNPGALVFSAMAHYQLGDGAKAREMLESFRELMKLPANARSAWFRDRANEAESLIGAATKPMKK